MKKSRSENKTITIAKELIKEFEGLCLEPYHCSAGMKTIGYGHVIRKNEEIANPITKTQAEAILIEDIKITKYALSRYCKVPLSSNQEAALISFIFNLGVGAFQSSALRQKLNRGEYILAADELLKWVYAGGVKLNGLIRRRIAERELFLNEITETKVAKNTSLHLLAISRVVALAKSFADKLKSYVV